MTFAGSADQQQLDEEEGGARQEQPNLVAGQDRNRWEDGARAAGLHERRTARLLDRRTLPEWAIRWSSSRRRSRRHPGTRRYDHRHVSQRTRFLEEERELWRPFEALDSLTDEQLDRPIDEAHDWSGRDLIAHLVALAVERPPGREGARRGRDIGDEGPIRCGVGRARRRDEPRHPGREWRALPMDEVRRRREVPGELRGYLTVVPDHGG